MSFFLVSLFIIFKHIVHFALKFIVEFEWVNVSCKNLNFSGNENDIISSTANKDRSTVNYSQSSAFDRRYL